MSEVFDYFDGAFFINTNRRTERRAAFEKQAQRVGIEVERFLAYELINRTAKYSCTVSHIEAIKEAKRRKWKSCLIFEDDCKFMMDNLKEKMAPCVDFLKKNKWDIFYLGGELNGESKRINEYVAECNSMYCTHAYAVHESFYHRIIELDPERGVIDILYLHFINRRFYMSTELLATQDTAFESDLFTGFIERDKVFIESYKKYLV